MSFSANIPALGNKITKDVPDQNALNQRMMRCDFSDVTDLPVGTKALVESADGWEVRQLNGTGWVLLEKWNIDAQKVDGHSASTGTTASTIPVRDADGKLPGDITGNADTASKAAALSATNPIATGGTGATTAEQARANLGVAPKSHASSSTEYGSGSPTQYGHLKSHDVPDSTKTAATGHAFSPAGAAAMQETLEGQIGDLAGVVSGNATAQSAKDAEQDAAIRTAKSEASSANSTLESDLRSLVSTEKAALQDAIQKVVPVGTVITFAAAKTPAGGFIYCNGAAVSRATYANLFAVIGTTYGEGDGSTTFNLPNMADKVIQGGWTPGTVYKPGLPNITSDGYYTTGIGGLENSESVWWGAVRRRVINAGKNGSGGSTYGQIQIEFDASQSNSIYGASNTVQPYALTMRFYIKY